MLSSLVVSSVSSFLPVLAILADSVVSAVSTVSVVSVVSAASVVSYQNQPPSLVNYGYILEEDLKMKIWKTKLKFVEYLLFCSQYFF